MIDPREETFEEMRERLLIRQPRKFSSIENFLRFVFIIYVVGPLALFVLCLSAVIIGKLWA